MLTRSDKIVLLTQEIRNAEGEKFLIIKRAKNARTVGNTAGAEKWEAALLLVDRTLDEQCKDLEAEQKAFEAEAKEKP
jgi:hypothetical protein